MSQDFCDGAHVPKGFHGLYEGIQSELDSYANAGKNILYLRFSKMRPIYYALRIIYNQWRFLIYRVCKENKISAKKQDLFHDLEKGRE